MRSSDVAAALREFAARIDAVDPGVGPELTVDVTLSPATARALVEALRAYHDPRDRGACDACGSRRLDDNFLCAGCGAASGVFGQLIRERMARYEGPPGELPGRSSAAESTQ